LTCEWATKHDRITLAEQIQEVILEVWKSPNRNNLLIGQKSYRMKEKDIFAPAQSILQSPFFERMREPDRAFMSLAIYLFLAEGAYASYMNFLCFLLVLQGHDLYDIFKRRFALSFGEIQNVNLEAKEQFLKEHDLDLFKKGSIGKMRNAIAHHDFRIEKDGTIMVREQMVDIDAEMQQLMDFMAFLHGATVKAFEQIEKTKTSH
jgi:hypothetical protein